MRKILIAALAALLLACGGGGDDGDEARSDRMPVDCKVTPEKCS